MIALFKKLARGETTFNIVGRAKLWALISGSVLILSLVGLFVRHLNLSLEFKGGTSLEVCIASGKTVTVPDVEDALAKFKLGEGKSQVTGDGHGLGRNAGGKCLGDRLIVRTKHVESDAKLRDVQKTVATVAGEADVNEVSIQDVGPTWGKQVSNKALRGLIVFLILVTIYISLRFEPKMAAGALVALFHDLLATAGIYALIGFEVSPATVIALLTLLGYSLYDTVVVFDRVGENVDTYGTKMSYTDLVNQSVNQVLMRSINTSLSTLLPIGALLFVGVFIFGAATLKDLALAMFMGGIVGAYSSIFVASPILALLKEREPRYKAARARTLAGATAPSARPAASAARATTDDPQDATPSVRSGDPMRVPRAAPRPRKRRRGKRR